MIQPISRELVFTSGAGMSLLGPIRIDISVAEVARPDYVIARLGGYLFAPEAKK